MISHCLCRPKWISRLGVKYAINDYVIVSRQEDDLPLFGKIESIVFTLEKALLCVSVYHTQGYDHHYHCYVLARDGTRSTCWLSDLVDYQPLRAHSRRDGFLCVVVRYHVEKL